MKKTLLIVLAVAAIIAGTWYADHATKLSVTRASVKLGTAPAPHTALAGKPAPDLKFKDLNGKDVALSDLKGKVVFLNFWATWCPPCVEEAASLEALQKHIAPLGGTVLGVSIDDSQPAYEDFLKQYGLTYPTFRDTTKKIPLTYGTVMYPDTYIIDRQGKLVRKIIGAQDWTSPQMTASVDAILAQH